jgi:energy-coupling factor transport system permease protein
VAPPERAVSSRRLPRPLHPAAWWLWALGIATAATRTTNPLLLLALMAAVGCVVACRRTDAPWARGFGAYLRLGLVVLAIRVVFRALFDGQAGRTVLFRLPELHLPQAAAGLRVGGPVSLEGVLAAVDDGARLVALLLCVGAANVLADPKRLLKSLPAALHEVGVAVTVALTTAPQLVESAQRVRQARRLRGAGGRRAVRTVLLPVLEDALDRSLVLASAMDSRGYGRRTQQPPALRRLAGACVLLAVLGVAVGTYGLLDATTPRVLGGPVLLVGVACGVLGLRLGGRRVQRSTYRPDPWRLGEWTVVACGVGAAALMWWTSRVDPDQLYPALQPIRWPTVGVLPLLAVVVGALPAWLAPPPSELTVPGLAPAAAAAP